MNFDFSSDQPQTFRRGGGTRQTSEGWRRSRGDDDENNEQDEDSSTPVNGSASWTSRGGQTRRGGGKVDQWNNVQNLMINGIIMMIDLVYKKKRYFCFNIFYFFFEKVHRIIMNQINNGGWRTNSSMSDRDLNSRRPQAKRDRKLDFLIYSNKNQFIYLGMPEWMDDNNDDDNQLSNATFEKDGTFTRLSSLRQNSNDEQQKTSIQSSTDESSSRGNTVSY